MSFKYDVAFSRDIGLLTREEQEKLKDVRIAIAGMGGVGSNHLISLIRQGFEKFHISDYDVYELKNLNRQYGARYDTVGKKKAEVMKNEAMKINPEVEIKVFGKITKDNVDEFLTGVDVFIDGLDFFEIDVRRMVFNKAKELGIVGFTVGPIGFGFSAITFSPDGMGFDEYFNINDNMDFNEKIMHFSIGLSPKLLARKYMKDIHIKDRKGPSSIVGINLCASYAVMNVLRIVLNKSKVLYAPYYEQFDHYRRKYVVGKLMFGNKGLVQRMKIYYARKFIIKD